MHKETIETERLLLRKLNKDDAEAIFSNWASDEEVTKYLSWNHHLDISTTRYILDLWLIEYNNPNTARFGIVLKETNELIGAIDVVDYIDGTPEVGYCLSRKHWNKGYMSEVCNAFVSYLNELGYQEILIEADERNIGSNRVIEKCGFEFTHQETKPCSSFKPNIITVNWYKKSF